MVDRDDTVTQSLLRALYVVAGWFVSIEIRQVQAVLGLISTALVIGYTAMLAWVLWRDRIRDYAKHRQPQEPPT